MAQTGFTTVYHRKNSPLSKQAHLIGPRTEIKWHTIPVNSLETKEGSEKCLTHILAKLVPEQMVSKHEGACGKVRHSICGNRAKIWFSRRPDDAGCGILESMKPLPQTRLCPNPREAYDYSCKPF